MEIGHIFISRSVVYKADKQAGAKVSSNSSVFPLFWSKSNGHTQAVHLYAALFVSSLGFFCLRKLTGEQPGAITDLMLVASSATCGWSWLMTRALFRHDAKVSAWPLGVVLLLSLAGAYQVYGAHISDTVSEKVGTVQLLLSSTVLLLGIAEPMRTLNAHMSESEKRFRYIFSGSYAALVGVTAVWIGTPSDHLAAQWGDVIKVGAAFLALGGVAGALWYRQRHPVSASVIRQRPATEDDRHLAARIHTVLHEEALYTRPSLRVSDLARRVGEAEYKVTQSLTTALGFRNFNHMINSLRIAQAKRMLSDAKMAHLPVLTIALDCGFASIGPFNRAFKAETGDTPTQFRQNVARVRQTPRSAA